MFLIINITFLHIVFAQNDTKDSLQPGRICKIVLYNSFQADGKILKVINDTLTLQTDITNLHIPVKDIKFILNQNQDVPEAEIIDTVHYEILEVLPMGIKMTDVCDVYLEENTELKDVRLIKDTDSTLKVFKEDRYRVINISVVRKIIFTSQAPFLKGALIGGGIGFLIGFIPPTFSKGGGHPDLSGPEFGLIFGSLFAVPSALIGGVLGVLFAYDEKYDFKPGLNKEKLIAIRQIMEKHY